MPRRSANIHCAPIELSLSPLLFLSIELILLLAAIVAARQTESMRQSFPTNLSLSKFSLPICSALFITPKFNTLTCSSTYPLRLTEGNKTMRALDAALLRLLSPVGRDGQFSENSKWHNHNNNTYSHLCRPSTSSFLRLCCCLTCAVGRRRRCCSATNSSPSSPLLLHH